MADQDPSPLQNRVYPNGDIVADPARGLLMGNRGGRFHDPKSKKLGSRSWATRQWISCVLDFKNRQRDVFGTSYTELFFLDEVSALSAGHRPCFECRRSSALAFAGKWQEIYNMSDRPKAAEMDLVLHEQRLENRQKRIHKIQSENLCDGVVVLLENHMYAVKSGRLLKWSTDGYFDAYPLTRSKQYSVLTPPIVVEILRAGYKPIWHETAEK